MIDNSTLYGISIAGMGLIGLIVRYSFRSKCSDVSLCFGLVHIQRDIQQEIEEQKFEGRTPSRETSMQNLSNV
jgi:hypothetical protein